MTILETTFDDFNLHPELLESLKTLECRQLIGQQRSCTKALLKGVDVVEISRAGSGKTTAFVVSALQKLDQQIKQCQCLVLASSRHAAMRVASLFKSLAGLFEFSIHCFIGGTDMRADINIIKAGVQVIVGTPGRISDVLVQNPILDVTNLNFFVIDDVDEVISRGFQHQTEDILSRMPSQAQKAVFASASTPELEDVISRHLYKPKRLDGDANIQRSLEGVHHCYTVVPSERDKFEALCILLDNLQQSVLFGDAIIFVELRSKADALHDAMVREGYQTCKIHKDMPSRGRNMILQEFKSGTTPLLVTTEGLENEIDIDDQCVLINYDIPSAKGYLQRVCRPAGHGSRSHGDHALVSVLISTNEQRPLVKAIAKANRTRIKQVQTVVDCLRIPSQHNCSWSEQTDSS